MTEELTPYPDDEAPVPDLVEPIIGIRAWYPQTDIVTLAGHQIDVSSHTNYPTIPDYHYKLDGWEPGINKATCHIIDGLGNLGPYDPARTQHHPPEPECSCGFYAYHGADKFDSNGVYGSIWGAVKAWGRICVARDGFRAEYAQVLCIGSPLSDSTTHIQLKQLSKRYSVPIVAVHQMEEFASEYGSFVPKELLPNLTPARYKRGKGRQSKQAAPGLISTSNQIQNLYPQATLPPQFFPPSIGNYRPARLRTLSIPLFLIEMVAVLSTLISILHDDPIGAGLGSFIATSLAIIIFKLE